MLEFRFQNKRTTVDITVEKVDDINYILRGTVANSVIEERANHLKALAEQEPSEDAPAERNFEQEAAGQIFQAFVEAGVKEAGVPLESLLGQPGLKKYEKQPDTVFFEVDIATSPEVNTDIDYSDVVPEYTKPVADPAAVEKRLEEFASKQSQFEPIKTPKSLEEGDVAVINFKGFIDGEPFEGGSAEKFNLQIGSKRFIPGFEEQLIGMEYGEERTIKVTFPEDYQAPDLAGKDTEFSVKLHEIQTQVPVVIDDDFAKRVLNDSNATVAVLKEKFADQVTAQELSELYQNELRPKLIEGLLGKFDFPLPNNIVEQEIDAKVREKLQPMSQDEQKQYLENKEKYIAMRESVRQQSKDGIKIAMIVEALAKKEGIDVDEQEVISALTYQAMQTGQDAQQLVNYYRDNNLMISAKLGLTEDKLFGKMLGFDR
jgi:trigger factor